MKLRHLGFGALGALAFTSLTSFALASSHREAPAISNDPAADSTDLWTWVEAGTHSNLKVVASYIPLEEPSGAPNFNKFSDDVLYEIHITRDVQNLNDIVTYQFRFTSSPVPVVDPSDKTKPVGGGKEFFSQIDGSSQTYTVTKIVNGMPTVIATGAKVAPPNIGPRTDKIAYAIPGADGINSAYTTAYQATYITPMGTGGADGKVFAGPTDDGFYVDLGGVFDLANLRPKGTAKDTVADYNVHTIAIEIPTTLLTANGQPPTSGASTAQLLGVYTTASRKKVNILRHDGRNTSYGPWVQVSRLGFPLINEAVVGIQDKDKYNRTKPATDVTNFGAYILNPVIVRDYEAVSGTTLPDSLKYGRADILDVLNATNFPTAGAHVVPLGATGDVVRVDMGVDSSFPLGRPLPDGVVQNADLADVVDIELSYLITMKLSGVGDGVDYNDVNYPGQFPYLPLPHVGWNDGHGSTTP